MKKIALLLFCTILVMSSFSTVFADSAVEVELEDSGNVWNKFLLIVDDIEDITVINKFGKDVDNDIADNVKRNLKLKNYDEVFNLLERHSLLLSYGVEENVLTSNGVEGNVLARNIDEEVNRTEYIYHLEYDKSETFKKEWLTIMKVRYTENMNGTLTALGNPKITIEANFGGSFSIDTGNISSGYKSKDNGRAIEFYGSYTLKAKLIYPVTVGGFEFETGRTFDWGTIYPRYTQR
ncbi:hypothetical protein [Tissierella sp.]|uniref:hypothetical protein n=1 Tax=Tissierella sp. TaxID=41274 RepID=UPI0028A9CBF8|nr:hypothetical protein [Tissierella sp.]